MIRSEQRHWSPGGWDRPAKAGPAPGLVLVFGGREQLESAGNLEQLRADYPGVPIMGCSTAGEIDDHASGEAHIVATALWFEHTRIETASVAISGKNGSRQTGHELAAALPAEGLSHVLVFSDGLQVNGSELVAGLTEELPGEVRVTGGLAGDGPNFAETVVVDDGACHAGRVVAVGLYGQRIHVGCGSLGGWDPFGPERLITASTGNLLSELDHQPALALYKRYLGDHAAELPASGLLFPLSVRTGDGRSFVRTILAVDDDANSMTFAGDMPQGAYARLMKANFDRLVDGAHGAARTSRTGLLDHEPQFALLISCVGRRLVLGQRTDEEVEAVRAVLGPNATMAGFYSYGEICPAAPNANCELHNQTMTITTMHED